MGGYTSSDCFGCGSGGNCWYEGKGTDCEVNSASCLGIDCPSRGTYYGKCDGGSYCTCWEKMSCGSDARCELCGNYSCSSGHCCPSDNYWDSRNSKCKTAQCGVGGCEPGEDNPNSQYACCSDCDSKCGNTDCPNICQRRVYACSGNNCGWQPTNAGWNQVCSNGNIVSGQCGSDDWYNKGSAYACCNGEQRCTSCQDQEYRDYGCSGGSCTYSVTSTRTTKSGCSSCGTDGWNYCSGDTRQNRNYYCSGGGCTYNVAGSENCNNYDGWDCSGTTREYRNYYCSGGSCDYSSSSQENCANKASTDTDGGWAYTTGGIVTDFVGCSGGTCTYDTHNDYCSGTSVYEYVASGSSYSGGWKNCEDYESNYCGSGDRVLRREWGCGGNPGYCADGFASDSVVEDCDNRDGWTSCSNGQREYRNYGCSGGSCTYTVTQRQNCVSITSIGVSPSTVDQGGTVTVSCGSSVAGVNCIDATLGGRGCNWVRWSGSTAVFRCTATGSCPTSETARCYVDTSKCIALSPSERTASVNVQCGGCNYGTSGACENDARCDWCNQCYSTKYTGGGARCVAAGTCKSFCWRGRCGAACDDTQDGCTATSQCSGTRYQTRSASCTGSCTCSYGLWQIGNCVQSKANCGAECGTDADCGANAACDQSSCTCYSTCTDECSPSGAKQCGGAGTRFAQTCGNYDADSCLEWNTGTDCGTDYCESNRYCCDSSTKVCRTCHRRGCTNGNCYDNTYDDVVQACSYGCSAGQCNANNPPNLGSVSASPNYVKSGGTITITSSGASDPNGEQIRLECGSTSGSSNLCTGLYVASDPSCAFSSPWGDNSAHNIYCHASDTAGVASVQKTASITADNMVDSVSVSHSPSEPIYEGANALVTITARTTETGSSINFINVYLNGNQKKQCSAATCDYADVYGPGTYQYYAVAFDKAGNSKQSSTASFGVAACGPGWECQVRSGKTCRYSNSGTWEWVSALGTETACADGKDNDCDRRTDRLDATNCGVEVTSISVSEQCPVENGNIDVSCSSSVANVNCIGAYIDYNNDGSRSAGEDCVWNAQSYWSGNNAVFAGCAAGSKINTPCKDDNQGRKAECYIQTDKCAQLGTSKSLYLDVGSDPCSNHESRNTCENDPKCKWAEPCQATKFYGDKNMPAGKCLRTEASVTYDCAAGYCGAACDGSVGCPAYLSSDTCYYGSSCSAACSCDYASSDYCPASGTINGNTCFYGTRSCTGSGCSLNTCTLGLGQVCRQAAGCVNPSDPGGGGSGAYEAVFRIRIPYEKTTYYMGETVPVRIKAWLQERATGNVVYVCDSSHINSRICKINSLRVHTSAGWRNYMTETNWDPYHTKNFETNEKEWVLGLNTEIYHSIINVSGEVGGIPGSDEEEYGVDESSELQVTVIYPDVDNFIVPTTPTGKPNFTMTMPIRFYAEVTKTSGLITNVCESPDCTATYGIDEPPLTQMSWNEFEKKFYAEHDSLEMGVGDCGQYHIINVTAVDTVGGLTNTTESQFFLSCTPRITASPVEKRLVLGDASLTAFDVTVWNPAGASTFDVVLSNIREDDELVLGWLSFDCEGEEGCTASDDTAILDVGELSSKTVKVKLLSADRAGSYALLFTATAGSKMYKAGAFLLVFAESLPEFSVAYLVVLFMIAVLIFAIRNDLFNARKR